MTLPRACAFSLVFLLFNAGLDGAPTGSPPLNDSALPVAVETCVSTQGYWTQHAEAWPLATMVLGDAAFAGHTYSKKELLSLLGAPAKGDASIILATQLIAAKLNVAMGANPQPVSAALARADVLLGAFRSRLPYGTKSNTPVGSEMAAVAAILAQYNAGLVPGSCGVANTAPVANAGPDQNVARGALVTLDGSASFDADGNALRYEWTLLSRPPASLAVLTNPTAVKPTFVADEPGTYQLQLIVYDALVASVPSMVRVSTENVRPIADAGADQTAPVTATVHLDGSSSTDADGNPLTFAWRILQRPASSQADVQNPSAVDPFLTLDAPGEYIVELVVSDGSLDSVPDTVRISTVNSAPVAKAGADATGVNGATITLDGSGSTDADGNALTYHWSLLAVPPGSAAALINQATVAPSFVIDISGEYVAQLIVNDGTVDSAADAVTITTLNSRPIANAGTNQTAAFGQLIELDGSGSTDVDGDALTYQWSLTTVPAGSSAALSDATSIRPTFTPDVNGLYVAQLIVSDTSSASDPDTTTVLIADQPVNQKPVAEAGTPRTVGIGETVTLDGSLSSDPNGDPLTYQWSLTPPPGSAAVLSDPTAAQPTFVADIFGNYVAQLIVNDGAENSAPDTVTISTLNSAPVAHAGSDRAVAPGTTVTLDGSASFDADNVPISYSWSLVTRPAGSAAVLSSTTTVNPSFVADTNGVYVAQLIVSDGELSSEPDTVAVTAGAPVDLGISFFGAPPNPPVGIGSDWGITLQNIGTAIPVDVQVSMPVPSGFTLVSFSNSGGTYNPATGIWTVNGFVSSGYLAMRLLPLATGDHTVRAAIISSSAPDPNPANNEVAAPATVNPNVDLTPVSFNFAPGTRSPGEEIGILVDVNNLGPAAAENTVIEFKIPAGFTLIKVDAQKGTYDSAAGEWTIGRLEPFVLARIIVFLRLNAVGPIDLRVVANSSSPDTNPADNVLNIPRNNRIPIANAGVDRNVSTHSLVTLDGSASFDPDGDPITFEWVSAIRPINSNGAFADVTTPTPSFTPDLPGNYTSRLVVRDNQGTTSVPDLVTIAVAVANTAPTFVSAPITSGFTGQLYQYDVNAADVDLLDVLQFSLVTAPAGMSIDPQTGVIGWLPGGLQGGAHAVVVRVQDTGGFAATQSFTIQVASPSNGAPVAADDDYSVRLGESLSVPAPGVTGNDTDASPLSARLTSQPGNGTVLFSADGSFTYTPHTMQPGEFVLAENINLASRMPGVVVSNNGSCSQCTIDEDINTEWDVAASFLVLTFPSDIRVSRVDVIGVRNVFKPKVAAGRVVLESAAGATLFDTGNVELPLPDRDGSFVIPDVRGVRRVRFIPDPTAQFFAAIAELKVIGSGLIQRTSSVEPNLVQLLPVTVQANNWSSVHVPEGLVDDSPSTNWFAGFAPGDFIEVTFPLPVTVQQLIASNPSARPDGFATSNPMECSGTFTVLDAGRVVLFDSGIVNEPSGSLNSMDTFTLTFPDIQGARHIRYTSSGCSAGFGLGFSEWRVLGDAPVSMPALSMSEKLQSLQGREAHSTPIVINLTDDNGDGSIDADDVPDIAVPVEATDNQLRGEIKVISGDDGRLLFTAGGPDLVSPWSELAAGDIDGDGRPEIIAVSAAGNRLLAFEHDGSLKWQSAVNAMPSFIIGSSQVITGAISIANLDGAGAPEIIVGASVFDANGQLLGDGRTLNGTTGGTGMRSAISAVADIDLDGAAELVAGPTAYRLGGGSLTTVWQRTDRADGYVAIANLDDDPEAEIVAVANGAVYALNHDGSDFQPWNAPSHAPVAIPGGGLGGAPLVVDVDGDGRPEIGVAGASSFVLFDRDGQVRWKAAISDRSSNSTGAVAFDLNGDGEVEIIYRDERWLRVYRGADGILLMKVAVGSATWSEEPVVADVDNDGHADIVVSSDLFAQSAGNTGIIVFQDIANRWTRTRRIWNQHAYHIVNVDENGAIPVSESAHWLTPGLNAFRTNAFVAGETADAMDSFTYIASDGSLESNAATVRIALRAPNAAPAFTSQPIATAAPGVVYTYAAQAVDPDGGDILTFSLSNSPEGMSIDPGNGLIEWTPLPGQTGPHSVVVKVADLHGLFALQPYTIDVTAPVPVPAIEGQLAAAADTVITAAGFTVGEVTSRPSALVAAGAVISQHPSAGTLAATGSPVNYVVSQGPPPVGVVPAVIGLTQGDATSQVSAAGFSSALATQSSSIVPAGRVLAQNPSAGTTAPAGSAVALVVSSGPPPGEIDLDGDGFTGDQGDCRDDDPLIHPNAIDIPGDGLDQNCNGVDSVLGDDTAPTAALVSPADLTEVTTPTDIVGTVADANFLRYTVQLAAVDATTFTVIGSGTAPLTSATVGRLDPTLLENGLYRVRLIAEDVNGQIAMDERVYRVAGEAKVGVFAMAFADLQVPVSGIPITVVRSYDSRVKTTHDFGVGWKLEVKRGTYRHNRTPGFGWTINDLPFLGEFLPCIGGTSEPLSHLTEVRLSDREAYQFKLAISNGNLGITGACEGTAAFQFVSGTFPGATLEILDGSAVIYLKGGPAEVLDMNAYLDGDIRIYNPRRVRLTTIDGRRIDFDPSGITRIEDDHDNSLAIGPAGIVHSSGKSIAFERDGLGRITGITDPLGATLSYHYDARGDLVAFRDQVNTVTTFIYDDRHNLVEIRDPLDRPALRSEFDSEGRLVATIDPRGRRTEFGHDVAARVETVTNALDHVTTFVYDERGNILSQQQPVTIDGATVVAQMQFTYDAQGNQIRAIDPDSVRSDSAFDPLGNRLSLAVDPQGLNLTHSATFTAAGDVLTDTDPNGNTSEFVYDANANPTQWIDVDGRESALNYDSAGHITRFIDPDGRATNVQYDTSGNVTMRTDSRGNTMSFTYDANGNRLTATIFRTIDGSLRALTTAYQYDGLRRVTAVIDPQGAVARTEYNAVGLRSKVVDPLGRETRFTYDEAGALVRVDHPDGTFDTLAYDLLGRVISSTNREGLTTQTEYDEAGRSVARILPDDRAARTIYSLGGRVAAQIAIDGSRTDYEYDGAGRMVVMRQPAVFDAVSQTSVRPEWRFEYDAGSRRTAVVDPKGNRTEFLYDSVAGTVTARRADGTQSVEARDQWGRLLARTDPEGHQTNFAYVADTSQLASVALPAPTAGAARPTWHFDYDEVGNALSQTDPLGRITRFDYDSMNRLTRTVLPGGQSRTLQYDTIGRLTGLTDFDGGITTYGYDAADRLVTKSLPGGGVVSYAFTPGGRRSTVTDARGLTSYHYDTAGRLIRRTQPGVGEIEYAYDDLDRVAQVTTAGGSTTYGYDALSRLTHVSGQDGTTSYAYDLTGNLARISAPNGVVGALAYDQNNQLTTLTYGKGNQQISSFGYTYTPSGRRATVAEASATTGFTYDRIGRLIAEVRSGTTPYARQYEYDAAGNRTRSIANALTTNYTYDVNDQLLSAGTVSFEYDARGNPTRRNDAGLLTTYTWTPENRLAQITRGVDTISYQYDADGTRVEKQTAAGTVRYLIDTMNPTRLAQAREERGSTGSLIRRYEYGLGIVAQADGAASRFYHPDGQGHVRMLTDQAGETVRSYDYDAFGNAIAEFGSATNDYRYGGQQFDDDANLYYLRARYYDPGVGRFLGRDPINGDPFNPVSMHRYAYAGNDPCNLADPTGEEFTLLGLSFAQVIQDGLRGMDVGMQLASRGASICRVKGLAKVVPMAIGLRSWVAGKSQLLENVIGMLSPSVGFSAASIASAISSGSVTPLLPSVGIAYKEEIFKHPMADITPSPSRLTGDPKKLEIEVAPTSLSEVSVKLTGELFPASQTYFSVGLQHSPHWAVTSMSGGVGFERTLFDIRVCGFISIGTVSFVAGGSFAATGLSSSGLSNSVELGLKMAIPFLPEATFTILKLPDDLK
jgi:RHS repeat-associated protein